MVNEGDRNILDEIAALDVQISSIDKAAAAAVSQKVKDDAFSAKLGAFKDRLKAEETAAARRRMRL